MEDARPVRSRLLAARPLSSALARLASGGGTQLACWAESMAAAAFPCTAASFPLTTWDPASSMTMKLERAGDVVVVMPAGRIDSGNASSIETEMLKVVSDGPTRIVVDLSEVEYISSAGLRVVLVAAKRQKQRSGTLVLCNPQPLVREIFEISGLLGVLQMKGSRSDAVAG